MSVYCGSDIEYLEFEFICNHHRHDGYTRFGLETVDIVNKIILYILHTHNLILGQNETV